jgi:hypothetical protein
LVAYSTGYLGFNGTINNFAGTSKLDLSQVKFMALFDCFYEGERPTIALPHGGHKKADHTRKALQKMNEITNRKVRLVNYEVTLKGTPNSPYAIPLSELNSIFSNKRYEHINLKSKIENPCLHALIHARIFDSALADGYFPKTKLPKELIALIDRLPSRGTVSVSSTMKAHRGSQSNTWNLKEWAGKDTWNLVSQFLPFRRRLWEHFLFDKDKHFRLMGWQVGSVGDVDHDGFIPDLGWEVMAP